MTSALTPFQIGPLTVSFPIVLAPMAGYTDSAFRTVCKHFGCGLSYTELTNAQAMIHGSRITLFLLEIDPSERPVAAHIYGSDPLVMAEAAGRIEKLNRFDLIDVNCGCPMRKIVARGAGAALMDHPDRIFSIVEAIHGCVSLPVTAKLRLGISPQRPTVSEAAQAAEEAGASMIAVHARFASSRHRGPADWEMLARVKSERRIPVIGNGGVATPADAFRMMSLTGVDGVMIGQAAIGHPWIFEQIGCLGTGQPVPVYDIATRTSVILDHFERLVALRHKDPRRFRSRPPHYDPENVAAMVFRAHLLKYVTGMEGARQVRARLNNILSLSDIRDALALVEDSPQESSDTTPLCLSAPADTPEK